MVHFEGPVRGPLPEPSSESLWAPYWSLGLPKGLSRGGGKSTKIARWTHLGPKCLYLEPLISQDG